jgi:type I restriction enzyme S subunit
MGENKKPAIRFRGFTDAWEQRKLGDIADRVVRKNTNLESTLPLTISAIYGLVDQITYFNNRVASRDVSNYYLVKKGEFAYNKSYSEGFPFGAVKRLDRYENGVLSTLYIVFAPKNDIINSDYLVSYYDTNNWHKQVAERAAEGARNHGLLNISAGDFFDTELKFPRGLEEQSQIGQFFQNLDNLITLHQRKYNKLQNIKKSMLEKMFPKNGKKTPEVRFMGFTDAWEQRKFSETFIYLQNNALSRADLNYEQGLIKNVHYGDVLIKFGEILDVDSAELPFISNNEFTVSSTSLLQNGDVIIADAAEDETVGKCSEIKGIEGINVVSGLHTIPCRPNITFASGYLGYYLNSSAYHDQLLPLIQGTKISSISKSALLNTDIIYPDSEQEQLQIGQFFQSLDNLITLHQRELDKLQNIKKSCLQKMFV